MQEYLVLQRAVSDDGEPGLAEFPTPFDLTFHILPFGSRLRAENDKGRKLMVSLFLAAPRLWPVHKSLCQADQTIFRQAPLTKRELADYKVLSDGMYQCGKGAPPGYDNVMPVRQVMQAATSLKDWSVSFSPGSCPTD